jgi:hypothetical protein
MTLEPRVAASGALWRWMRQATELLRRSLGFSLGLMLFVCLLMFASHRLPLVEGVLAVAALLACMLMAAQVDRGGPIRLGEALGMLRAHAGVILGFAALITVAGALVWLLLLKRPDLPWWNIFYTQRHSVQILSADTFIALRQVFVYSAFALGLCYFGLNIPGLTSFFQFPCMVLLGLPFRDAWRLSAAGQIKNLGPMFTIALSFVLLPVICGLWLPLLMPVLYSYLGALSYVAFREIFLGVDQNQPLTAAQHAPMSAPAPLSSRA